MTPQAGIGNSHPRRGRAGKRGDALVVRPEGKVYSTHDLEPEQPRELVAEGGKGFVYDPGFKGIRVYLAEQRQTRQVDCEALTWFARHFAIAEWEEAHGFDGQAGNKARDPQYLSTSPGTNKTILVTALHRAREAVPEGATARELAACLLLQIALVQEEQEAEKDGQGDG